MASMSVGGLTSAGSNSSVSGSGSSNQGVVNTEFDPIFIKAIRLLHSQAKDSADQLKTLLDDILNQRSHHSSHHSQSESAIQIESRRGVKRPASSRSSSPISASVIRFEPKDTAESKKQDDSESTDIEDEDSKGGGNDSSDNDANEQATDAGDFAMELGLACVVCKGIDVSSGNQLVECQECHALYHQECHKPSVTDADVSDPRLVWYCSKCQKNLKKIATKPNKVVGKQPSPPQMSAIKEPLPTPVSKPFTIVKSEPSTTPFKRTPQITTTISGQLAKPSLISSSSTSSSPTASNTRPVGLAGFAANISRSSSLSSTTSSSTVGAKKPFSGTVFSSSTTSAPPPPTASMASADKRLQSMKKKAQQKQQRF